ncbi:MAG: hypothetical protein IKE28_04450 [Solobacterium sp.]|nr:hypothetical protein [Solobacterium sp.]
MAEDIRKIEETELDNVSGGGLMDKYSDEEYDAAGITILDPGWIANDGYFLRNSKEYIDEDLANKAVRFFKKYGRSASCSKEIYYFGNTGKAMW